MKESRRKKTSRKQLVARRATRKDLDFWVDLYEAPAVQRQMYAAPLESKETLWHYLNGGQKAFTVWDGDRRIGGFLLSTVAPFLGTFSIVVHKDFRGAGYGRAVMGLLESEARKAGYRTLRADIYVDNPASIHLVKKCGFRRFTWFEKNL